ncbi:MAG: hypothetical protein JG773_169 [Spirochaeta sp.]|nr:hypothetical protein [Spirochaeta sp.]
MIIERAKPSDYQELKQLWLVVFNEEPAFLEHFFATRISYQDIFVAREDDKLVSALHALPLYYHKRGEEHPTSYIVGAATYKEYRRRGIMGKLLEATRQAYDHPITLFPAVRPFYEANGYFTTSSVLSFTLEAKNGGGESLAVQYTYQDLDRIYRKATSEEGALLRDEKAWSFLTDGYEVLSVEGGYAFISEGKAVETMVLSSDAASSMLSLLKERGITEVHTLASSPLAKLLGRETGVPIPMGMSTSKELQGVYIAEQY